MLPQLMHKMQQIQTLMAQMHNQLNNTNKNGGNDNNNSGGNKTNKVPFLYYSTSGLMMNSIIRVVFVAPRKKVAKKMQLQINNSTVVIRIFTIVIIITIPDGVVHTVK